MTNVRLNGIDRGPKLEVGQWSWWYIIPGFPLSILWLTIFSKILAGTKFYLVAQVFGYFAAAVTTVGVIALIRKKNLMADFSILGKKGLIYNIGWGLAAGVVAILAVKGLEMIFSNSGTSATDSLIEMEYGKDLTKTIVTTLLVTAFAPFMEELFFRGLVYKSIRDTLVRAGERRNKVVLSEVIAMVIAIAAFISVHMTDESNYQTVIMYIPMAFLFGFVYLRTGSLLASVVAHTVNNTNALIGAVLALNKLKPEVAIPTYYIAIAVLGAILAVALCYLFGKIIKSK